jgi:hypothetical protein
MVIIVFMAIATLTFLKPYLHMSSSGEFRTDREDISTKFQNLPMTSSSFGLCLGIIGFSTVLTSLTCVPELLLNENKNMQSNEESQYHNYFNLPLFLGTFFAVLIKCTFAIFGAMMLTDDSNLFGGLLFNANPSEGALVMLGIYCLFVVLPQSIDFQKQAKYLASLASEDAIPCN